jgi:hypothetical protein
MLLLRRRAGLYYWIGLSYLLYVLNTTLFAISALILIIFLSTEKRYLSKQDIRRLSVLIYVLLIQAVSYYFGTNSQFISAALTFSNITIFVLLINNIKNSEDMQYMTDAYYISAFLFAGVTILTIITSGGSLFTGSRLQFEDNVRDMANGIVVAVYIWIISIISGKKYGHLPVRIQNIIGAVSTLLLILTLSKGAIIALIFGIVVYAVLAKKTNVSLIIIAILFALLVYFFQTTGLVDFGRFLQRNNDLNGRTRIWMFYAEKVFSRGIKGVLFGLGPGNVTRVAVGEYLGKYYAHSVILDFFFSYGLAGFVSYILLVVFTASSAIRKRNEVGIGLLVMIHASYFVTGASTNTQVFLTIYYIICLQYEIRKRNDI